MMILSFRANEDRGAAAADEVFFFRHDDELFAIHALVVSLPWLLRGGLRPCTVVGP
jgi:hypothetical protein